MKKALKKRTDIIQKSLLYKNRNEEIRMLSEMVNSDFLDAIKLALQNRGINPSRLANDIGVSKSYVSQVFNGNRILNIPFITRIRREYAIPLELIDTSRYVTNVTIVSWHSNDTLKELEEYPSYVASKTIDIPCQEIPSSPQPIKLIK